MPPTPDPDAAARRELFQHRAFASALLVLMAALTLCAYGIPANLWPNDYARALAEITGRRPVGTRSEHTLSLLKQEGFLYTSHDCADHGPYYLTDAAGEATMLNLPFHYAIDDAMFYSFAWLGSGNVSQRITDTDRVFDLWWAAFLQQYHAGGYLNVCLHPFVSGRAQRIDMLDQLITRMKSMPGVWFPTCEQVARHCLENYGL